MKPSKLLPAGKLRRLCPWAVAKLTAETLLHSALDDCKKVVGAIRARDLKALCTLGTIEDREYQDLEIQSVLAKRQVASLFKKNAAFTDDEVCSNTALDTFERAERICRITNKRLDHFHEHRQRLPVDLRKQLSRMEGSISSLLGDFDEDALNDLAKGIRVTSGATEDRTRRRSYPFLKLSGKLRAPSASEPYLKAITSLYGIDWDDVKFTPTESNSVTLVPKNWKTHRTIAKEPTHALPFQLSLDAMLKRRLKRKWGIDLSSQKRNQELARIGSLDGSYATIDLAMASDTLSYNAVAWMLPAEWRVLFDSFRSRCYKYSRGEGTYAKYSSMGNGYTFTLETLIFAAACKAVGSKTYSVYGDDIVIESELAQPIIKLLSFLGFSVNVEKSFINPQCRFRESCGSDYYNGRFVTPFYLRECPKRGDQSGLSHVVNGLVGVTFPGPLWVELEALVSFEKLRLVPWNADSRSGVFIPVHDAYHLRKLYTDKSKKPGNPLWGFQVFRGYCQKSKTRVTRGWRSLLLWHMSCRWEAPTVDHIPSSSAGISLAPRETGTEAFAMESSMARTTIRTVYKHSICRYNPPTYAAPDVLPLWGDIWTRLPAQKPVQRLAV